jgi:hypothetical protein
MHRCDNCGNAYKNPFKLTLKAQDYFFDSFECAIQKLAPHCLNCDTRIIGHGLESGGEIFCCAGCARAQGVLDLIDHSENIPPI